MAAQRSRFFTLLQREFREYRTSLLWTPLVIAGALALLMLVSVVLANRIGFLGDFLLDGALDSGSGVNFRLHIGEDNGDVGLRLSDGEDADDASLEALPPVSAVDYEVLPEPDSPPEAWEFSREWTFNPSSSGPDEGPPARDLSGRELNPVLSVVHGILLLVLLITSANYLLGSLYEDRKDRSILFWRSMPVSEWEVVLSKFVVALALAPLIYIAISLLLQLAFVLLMMLLLWRVGRDPFEVVSGNLDFVTLMSDPISGWLLTALWIAPAYAWLLLASAAARRSPFMLALLPIIALMVGEGLLLGSTRVLQAVRNHVPHASDSSAVGFYLFSMGSGLLFAALALAAAVWLRRHRWEL